MGQPRLIVVSLLLLACGRAHAQPAWTDDDVAKVDRIFGVTAMFTGRPPKSLHDMPPTSSGVKGADWAITAAPVPLSRVPGIESTRELATYWRYCGSRELLVVAVNANASRLLPNETAIFTKSDVTVTDVLRSTGSLQIGTHLVIVRRGGELVDRGEPLVERVNRVASLTVGASYLVDLMRIDMGDRVFRSADVNLVDVREDRIFPADGSGSAFRRGTSMAAIKREFERVTAEVPCPPPRRQGFDR